MRNWIVIRSTIAVLTGGEKKETENDADDDAEDVTEGGPERAADKHFAHVAQHVVAHAFGAGRVDVAVRRSAIRRACAWPARATR